MKPPQRPTVGRVAIAVIVAAFAVIVASTYLLDGGDQSYVDTSPTGSYYDAPEPTILLPAQ